MIYTQTPPPTQYLVDDANVTLIPDDPDWKVKAAERIDQYRKADINVV